MAYPALSDRDLENYKSLDFSRQQLAKANEQAIATLDARQRRLVMSYHPGLNSDKKEIRLLLLGKTGSGKSATGNLIVGKKVFQESLQSVSCTDTIQGAACTVDGVRVTVIDTPGFCDTGRSASDILREIKKVIEDYEGDFDGFLYVFSQGNPRYTQEEKSVFKQIQQMSFLEEDIIDNCFVVLTNGEKMLKDQSMSEYMEREGTKKTDFGHLLSNTVQGRVIAVENGENTSYGRKIQREQIVRMVIAKYSKSYNLPMFHTIHQKQRDIVRKLLMHLRYLVPIIERKIVIIINGMTYHKITNMSTEDCEHIACTVLGTISIPLPYHENTRKLTDTTKELIDMIKDTFTGYLWMKQAALAHS